MKKTEDKNNKSSKALSGFAEKKDQHVDILADDHFNEAKKDKTVKQKKAVTEVKARARFLRMSPRKAQLVVNLVKGLSVDLAVDQLRFINKAAVKPVLKVLNSAIANAEHNFKLKREDLFIKYFVANQGPTLHRWKPAAFGRAHPINKRTTHLEIILGLKETDGRSPKVKQLLKTFNKKVEIKEKTNKVEKYKKAAVSAAVAKADKQKAEII